MQINKYTHYSELTNIDDIQSVECICMGGVKCCNSATYKLTKKTVREFLNSCERPFLFHDITCVTCY